MKIKHILSGVLLLLARLLPAQAQLECNPTEGLPVVYSELNINYGSTTNAFNQGYKSNLTYGQAMVGGALSQGYILQNGFWSSQLLPPQAPVLQASQGDFPDQVLLSWDLDPLSSPPLGGFIIKRNGAFLASVSSGTRQFIDFNVMAGQFYEYSVQGVNEFGEGDAGIKVGFVNPNGLVIGQVTTFSGNPVQGALVTLTPTVGRALAFDGDGGHLCVSHSDSLPTDRFTTSAWVKVDNGHDRDGILDLGSDLVRNWWILTTPAGMGKGVVVGVGDGTAHEITHEFTAQPDGWHHVALSYGAGVMLLYVDGELVSSRNASMSREPALFTLGSRRDKTGTLHGKLDDARIYRRLLTQSELLLTKDVTVSKETEALAAYWKFDEGLGTRVFDLSPNGLHGEIFGAVFSPDNSGVKNGAITNIEGYYAIEGVNYQSSQLFTATPSKDFFRNYSLEFNAIQEAYTDLTDFDLPDTAAVTVTLKAFDFGNNQAVLSKADAAGNNKFVLCLNNGNLDLVVEGVPHTFGSLDMAFHHLAVNLEQQGGNLTTSVYQNGSLLGTHTFSGVATDWSGLPWKVGGRADGVANHTDFFTGLVDEVVFFNGTLSLPDIQTDANIGTDGSRQSLRSRFAFNESTGTTVRDDGPALSGNGTIRRAAWSTIAKINDVIPHEFSPSNRLVTLNPSNTSVDQVNFTDQSTIPVSGYVRFEGTNCFQKKVEILVNGQSRVPQIFTDEDGRFVADFEPGSTVVLSPKFEEHTFIPAFWELNALAAPVAGVLFRNQTKRTVTGQVAGGLCRKSVIPENAIVKVKVSTLNGCFEKVLQLEEGDGKFVFENIPPDSVTVALIEHSNPIIYTYYQNLGGYTVDLKQQNDTVDFIYLAPPEVELSTLDTNECGVALYNMMDPGQVTIKVFETYDGGVCYLDTAKLTIDNEIADLSQFDTLMTEGSFKHKFKAGGPNILSPYLKGLQVTAEAHDELATATTSAVVLGRRPRQTTFASTSPSIPTLILRDPPGDGSSAFLETGSTTCQNWSYTASYGGSLGASATLSLGADLTTSVGVGAEVELEIEATADYTFSTNTSYNNLTTNESTTCMSVVQNIATSSDPYVVGSNMGGDVYMGGAMNYIFGITDELLFDTTACDFYLDKGLYVFPNGFATTFIYSERTIKESVIPDLLLIGDTASAERWQGIIDLNNSLKESAIFTKNISFDAGVVYSETETTEVTKSVTNEWAVEFSTEFVQEFGLEVNGIGLGAGITMGFTTTQGGSSTTEQTRSRTVGYTLADDDGLDQFTINVKKDPVYGTPVFDLVSGKSVCPWEPGTQPREEVQLSIDKNVAVNIPENDVAVFKLTIGNTAPSGDVGFYIIELVPESNPDGAVVFVNGVEINSGELIYQIPSFGSLEVTVAVARGVEKYAYENLRLALRSGCEFERAIWLGLPRELVDPKFYKEVEIDVYFLEPCSPVDIGFPLQGWVVTPASGTNLNVTLSGYDKEDPDLELVRVQYRRTVGDGAWINIAEIPAADLGAVFTIVPWNTQGLQDGEYDIRAITQCFSGALNPGISHIIKGRIERTPPEIFGTPEPADGVLSAGDEISISFNEPIRCDLLIPADVFNNNNVGLYNTRTGDLVDAGVSCNENKIVVVPNVPNKFIENEILRVEVDSVKDLAGNSFGHADWEFFVDRNAFRWLGNDIHEVVYEGQALTVVREIENISGSAAAFTISGIPDWVDVFPSEGNLAPGSAQPIVFKFEADLPRGEYLETILAEGALGDEPMVVHLRKLCEGPIWAVDPAAYSYSMNFTVQLDIEGELSVDEMDRVGAFVNGQLRGVARIQYEKDIDKYLAFLTVYSNSVAGETIDFQIWDADECLLYGEVVESFSFTLDAFVGSPITPQVLHTNNLLLRKIPLGPGWNWVSFNLDAPDKSTAGMLNSLDHPQDGLIKSQIQFSQFSVPLSQWLGSLTTLGYKNMYQYRSAVNDTILLVGKRIIPDTVNIPINTGWNWISYLPNEAMTPNEALASLLPLNNDIIKGRSTFAQYVAGIGWIGNLDFLSPPNGYMLKISNPGVLVYPPDALPGIPGGQDELPHTELSERGSTSIWNVDPSLFEYSMNLVAVVGAEGNLLGEGDVVGAFVDNELRGGNEAVWVEPLDAWLVFLTVYANEPGENTRFKYYDASEEEIHRLNESIPFTVDAVAGSVDAPQVLTLEGTTRTRESLGDDGFRVFPNPARASVFAAFSSPGNESVQVRITDSMGRLVRSFERETTAGPNLVTWDTADALPGQYLVSLFTDRGVSTQKVTVLR